VDDVAKFRVCGVEGSAADGLDESDIGVGEALAENTLPDHTGRAEEEDFHAADVAMILGAISWRPVVVRPALNRSEITGIDPPDRLRIALTLGL